MRDKHRLINHISSDWRPAHCSTRKARRQAARYTLTCWRLKFKTDSNDGTCQWCEERRKFICSTPKARNKKAFCIIAHKGVRWTRMFIEKDLLADIRSYYLYRANYELWFALYTGERA